MLVPNVKASLHLSDFQIGVILGPAFAVVFAVFGIPLGWAADRYSRRWVILLGALVFGVATGSSGFATTFGALLVLRIMVGIGEASLTPAAMSLIAAKIPRERLTTAVSIFSMGPKVGSSAAYAVGGVALVAAAALERSFPSWHLAEPWRLTLGVAAIPTILVGLLALTFSEPGGGRKERQRDDQSALAFMLASRRLMIPFILGFCAITICGQSLIAWVPAFVDRQFNLSAAAYGPMLGAISMAGALTLVFKGVIMDRLFAKGIRDIHIRFYTWLLIWTFPLAAGVFLLRNAIAFFIVYAIVAIVTIPFVAYMTVAVQMVTPPQLRGRVTATTSIPIALVGSLGPLVVGGITDFVFHDETKVGWSLSLVMTVMIPVTILCLRRCLPALRDAIDAR
ncbi:MFS transporter [Hephaestia sp. CMS5P-6]|nr:MFS transporter [Hephaestia mangrovi]